MDIRSMSHKLIHVLAFLHNYTSKEFDVLASLRDCNQLSTWNKIMKQHAFFITSSTPRLKNIAQKSSHSFWPNQHIFHPCSTFLPYVSHHDSWPYKGKHQGTRWHYLVAAFSFSDKCPGKEGNSRDSCPKVWRYILTLKTPVPHLCCQAIANHPGGATFFSNLTHCQRHPSSVCQALIGRIFVPASINRGKLTYVLPFNIAQDEAGSSTFSPWRIKRYVLSNYLHAMYSRQSHTPATWGPAGV